MAIIAKRPSGKRVGLALSSGAVRGLAHIGVLEILEEEGIPIDMIAGTSSGALVGAVYASHRDIQQIKTLATDIVARRFFFADPAFPRTGFIQGRRLENTLRTIIGDIQFKDLSIPFACVATDLHTGDAVVFKEGPVWQAVRASSALPIIMSAVKLGKKYLVDGALVNPVPVSILKSMGADLIIAVTVISPRITHELTSPGIFSIMMQIIYITSNKLIRDSLTGADIVIEPKVENISFFDFHHAQQCIELGKEATRVAVPGIKRLYAA